MELFIDSNFVMANDRLARFYGLPALKGDAFVPVKLSAKSQLGGLVAQADFLKLTSTYFATSPIHRGGMDSQESLKQKDRAAGRYTNQRT